MVDLSIVQAEFIDWMRHERRMSAHTQEAYLREIRQALQNILKTHSPLSPAFTLDILMQITSQDIRSWLAHRLDQGLSARSNARALSALKTFARFILKRHEVEISAIIKMQSPRFGQSLPRPSTHAQLLDVINSSVAEPEWVSTRDLGILVLIYSTGLRISEVLALTPKDVEKDTLLVKGKGKKERIVPLLEEAKHYISHYIQKCPYTLLKDSPLFVGKQGKPLNPGVFQRYIRNLRRTQNWPESFTPHALRHTFATELLKNNMDLRTLQTLLGHESLSTTQLYTQISDPQLTAVYNKAHPRNT